MFKLRKKTVGLVMAGTIIAGSMGTTAYAASGNQWDALITKGIDKLYTVAFPEIKQKTDEKKIHILDQITADINGKAKLIAEAVKKHKENLIERNEKELDNYYEQTVTDLEATADIASKHKKDELTNKADQELENAKKDIDAKIQSELVNLIK